MSERVGARVWTWVHLGRQRWVRLPPLRRRRACAQKTQTHARRQPFQTPFRSSTIQLTSRQNLLPQHQANWVARGGAPYASSVAAASDSLPANSTASCEGVLPSCAGEQGTLAAGNAPGIVTLAPPSG